MEETNLEITFSTVTPVIDSNTTNDLLPFDVS